MAKQRYDRSGDVLDDDTVLVVRGGDLDRDVLRQDAERMFSVYGVYGISVFSLRDISLDELAQQPPLVRFARLTLVTVGVLRRAGLQLEATGRNPQHFTIGFGYLEDGVERLCACEYRTSDNPYYEY